MKISKQGDAENWKFISARLRAKGKILTSVLLIMTCILLGNHFNGVFCYL